MATEMLNPRKKRVFDSVFGAPTLSQPTPVATPIGGFTTPGQAFGGPNVFAHDRRQAPLSSVRSTRQTDDVPVSESSHVRDQVRWDRSWHTVTHALLPPDVPSDLDTITDWGPDLKDPNPAFVEALRDVIDPRTRLPHASHTEDIIMWHTNQVRYHFLRQVLPIILRMGNSQGPEMMLIEVIKFLEAIQRPYIAGLKIILTTLETVRPGASPSIFQRLRRDLNAIINHSITDKIAGAMKFVLRKHIFTILSVPTEPKQENLMVPAENYTTEHSRSAFLNLVGLLQQVGLAGERFQIAFAEVMNDAMTDYVSIGCKGIWSAEDAEARKQHNTRNSHGQTSKTSQTLPRSALRSRPSECVTNLCEWIENGYARLAVQVFHALCASQGNHVDISWKHVENWKEMGIGHLGSLRTNELFDIVVNWPHSSAALDDLRTAITTPQRRLRLTEEFSRTINETLLHPGASTQQILRTYISMISSFHALDQSKILLDRVAYPLQAYLCAREDTVRIIITGLLAETEDAQGNPIRLGGDKLVELALLLNNGEDEIDKANDDELDWHDAEWMPDPVDAGPGYKRSKNADILGTLIRVLGSQDMFIKEFQKSIGDRLLKNDDGFEKEVKVLELLKVRFGEAPLQSCEVMFKDIQDSGRLNTAIRKNQRLDPSEDDVNIANANFALPEGGNTAPEGMLKPSLHAKVLSRLYWPQLQDETYRVPDEIGRLQKLYEDGFESLKAARKLTWLHALGEATVELELTDRKITEDVHTWQAAVISAFQGDGVVRRSVEELVEQLEMDETLVRGAVKFWANKLVLQEVEKDVFSVLETLNQEDRARSNAQAAASAAAAPDDGPDDAAMAVNQGITAGQGVMYWQFIHGMLKNSSSQMPLQQIATMLKMLISDGFPFSNEELQTFLGTKIADGELEFVGGKYRLKK